MSSPQFDARKALREARSLVVWGAGEYFYQHADKFALLAQCTHAIPDAGYADRLPSHVTALSTGAEVAALDRPLVIIARAATEEVSRTSARLRDLGVAFDHLSFYATRSRSPRYLRALGRDLYVDYLGNSIAVHPNASARIELRIGEIGACRDNAFEIGDVQVRERLSILAVGSNSLVRVGNASTFVDAALVVNTGGAIDVGEDCMFAREIEVNQSDQHHIFDLESGLRVNLPRDIAIGDHVWVGRRVLLLGGARIGSGSVVGSAAVTSGVFGSNVVLAGSPAKVIRERIIWSRDLIKDRNLTDVAESTDQGAIDYRSHYLGTREDARTRSSRSGEAQ